MNNDSLEEKLIEYVMGGLTPEEEREIELYLNKHPQLASQVRDMFEVMADVALAQEPVALPDDAEAKLLSRIRGKDAAQNVIRLEPNLTLNADDLESDQETSDTKPSKPPSSRIWLGFALAAALVVFAYLGLRPQPDPVARQLRQICAEQGTSCETIASDQSTNLGTLAIRSDNSLFVVLNEAPPEGQVYQAWEIIGDTPVSLGVWSNRVLDISQALSSDSVFGVTIEPPGGSPQPTSTPVVVVPLS